MKTTVNAKTTIFFGMPQEHAPVPTGLENRPGTLKSWPIAHENGYKREHDKDLVMPQEHALVPTSHENCPRIPKSWAIAHENSHKTRKL